MDYFIPTAGDIPPIHLKHLESPSPNTALGTKGVGEVGAIGPYAALANAVEDALSPFHAKITELPLKPEYIWNSKGRRS